MNTKYFECQCFSMEHLIRASYFDEDIKDNELYITYHLPKQSFFKRLWTGTKYILGYRSKYGEFGEAVWDKNTTLQFANFIQTFLQKNNNL